MNTSDLLALYDQQQRIERVIPDVRREVTPHVVRNFRAAPAMNWISYSWLEGADADAIIAGEVAVFRPLGQPFSWNVLGHDKPAGLVERLAGHGFVLDEPPGDLMALEIDEAPPDLLRPTAGVDLRPITQPEGLADVIRIEEQVWGGNFGWMTQRMGGHLAVPDYLSIYVAYVDQQPACAGWVYFDPGSQFANLFGGSTVERYRGRGLYTAVLAARLQEARRRSRRFLSIDASPMSKPIVAKHGFRLLTQTFDCEWKGE